MAARVCHRAADASLQWLRVGAVVAGVGAAITAGQGVAGATPSHSTDPRSPGASADAGAGSATDGTGEAADNRAQEATGSGSAPSAPSPGRRAATSSSPQTTDGNDTGADEATDSEPGPAEDAGVDEDTDTGPILEETTTGSSTAQTAEAGPSDSGPDGATDLVDVVRGPDRTREPDESKLSAPRVRLPGRIVPMTTGTDISAQAAAASSVASTSAPESAAAPTVLASVATPGSDVGGPEVPPAPAADSVIVAAAPPAVPPGVTLNSIVSDVLTWVGWGPLATGLPVPVVPLPTLIQSMWLVVRQTHYLVAPVGASYLTGQVTGPVAEATGNPESAAIDPSLLADLLARAGVDVTLNPDGTVSVIGGSFTDATVISSADGARLLNELAPLLGASTGFANPDNITVEHVAIPGAIPETIYRLRETVNGIPVVGSEVILVTDENGQVTALFNNHDVRVGSLDAIPDGRLDDPLEAVVAATLAYFFSAITQPYLWPTLPFMAFAHFEPQLVLSSLDPDAPPELVWRVAVDPFDPLAFLGLTAAPQPGNTYFIDASGAETGTVRAEEPHADFFGEPTTTTGNDLLGNLRTINVGRLDLFLFAVDNFTDFARGIAIHQWVGLGYPLRLIPDIVTVRGAIPALVTNVIPFVQYIPIVRDIPVLGWLVGGWNPSAVSGLANMAAVYDYYQNVLGRTSFDGNGAEIIAVVDYNPGGPLFNLIIPFPNAWWSPGDQMMVFGRNYGAALDIVGHEFTHAVVSYVVGGLGGGESGALNEAYADILGNLIEGKTDAGRWYVSEDMGRVLRDMADPSSLSNYLGPYPDHYDDRYTGPQDNGGVHQNSTIFSHAAYLMMTDPATSDISPETWAGVFYGSLHKLSPGAKFSNARAAILQTAKDSFGFTDAQLAAVKQAFDDVGIA